MTHAQTDYEIGAGGMDLEAEYRDELDKWMLRAYEGDRDAQFRVGVLFTNDQFDDADYAQAVYWYKQAARQGHILAQYNLGHQYLTGVGVEQDENTAMQWWLEAAKQDHPLAQFNIGRAYYLGIGVLEDHSQSKYWFERAAANEEPKSIAILQQLGWADDVTTAQATPGTEPVSETASATETETASATETAVGETEDETLASRIVPLDQPESAGETTDAAVTTAPAEAVDPSAVATASDIDSPDVDETLTSTGSIAIALPNQLDEPPKHPLALYTNPARRSVLIAILDYRDSITLNERGDEWTSVRSSIGFPVWVHGDYVEVDTDGVRGTITGRAVNARSVPIVIDGTVVGRFNDRESVDVLSKRKGWYRVTAPSRFDAWVKTVDYDSPVPASTDVVAENSDAATPAPAIQPSEPATEAATTSSSQVVASTTDTSPRYTQIVTGQSISDTVNDNGWLFGQMDDSYTLQLASFDDQDKINEFTAREKFINNPDLHRFTSRGRGILWTYFLYGSYPDRAQAESVKLEIDQKLAWIRTFGKLKQNRCLAWKKQLPPPRELNLYCTQ